MHGQGTLRWASGERYDGEWIEGEEDGLGVFTWRDSTTYDGFWHSGKKHGIGVCTTYCTVEVSYTLHCTSWVLDRILHYDRTCVLYDQTPVVMFSHTCIWCSTMSCGSTLSRSTARSLQLSNVLSPQAYSGDSAHTEVSSVKMCVCQLSADYPMVENI